MAWCFLPLGISVSKQFFQIFIWKTWLAKSHLKLTKMLENHSRFIQNWFKCFWHDIKWLRWLAALICQPCHRVYHSTPQPLAPRSWRGGATTPVASSHWLPASTTRRPIGLWRCDPPWSPALCTPPAGPVTPSREPTESGRMTGLCPPALLLLLLPLISPAVIDDSQADEGEIQLLAISAYSRGVKHRPNVLHYIVTPSQGLIFSSA